ncbi:hypothetical protein [Saccharospirillum impatiens]|uniref:hypothetical protein n=1 Tax=Saccharospirillum impatiens TaxID=169438 RepID=UPI001B7F8172|nr:hypothetical protein [Saccharospirillum impatiens]
MKLTIGVFFFFTLVVLGVWGMDIATDRAKVVEITTPVSAYPDWECGYSNQSGCSVVFKTRTDAKYGVHRIRYGKDFIAIKIQQHGLSGWVFFAKR